MLRAIILSSDRVLAAQLHAAIVEVGTASVVRVIDTYPTIVELSRTVRAHAPQLVFITTESVEQVVTIAEHLEQVLPGIQVIAAGEPSNPETLKALMRGGIREIVASPFDPTQIRDSLSRAEANLSRRPVAASSTEYIYSFLPSKPGVGASTLAVNSALGIAREEPDSALLADFDLNSGIIRFLLKLDSPYTVLDAAERAGSLDENSWAQMVCKSNGLDVLHSGVLNPDIRLQTLQLHDMINYARRNYQAICFDLSGNLEKYSLELMRESRRIFLVCTPEICSLYLAREKMQYLKRIDLGDRVSILLNRYHKRNTIGPSQVEDVVRAPVLMTFQNDYNRITASIAAGGAVDHASELGQQYAALSSYMREKSQKAPAASRRSFVEYFNVSPARFTKEKPRLVS
jgi:pilus assembly protein CpaE